MSEEPELDVEKQIAYWRNGALSTWDDALYLISDKRIMLGLFAVHLALEKAVKAHVVRKTGKLPPKIHNLIRLSELASLDLGVEHRKVLAEINEFNIEGRYSDMLPPPITLEDASFYLKRAKGTFEWLVNLL
jgi:HEPN domain-containing protein